MPDINLTQDEKFGGGEKKKNSRASFEYTDPSREKKQQDERKAPGSARMWFKSLFRRTPPGETDDASMPQELTPPPMDEGTQDDGVEDIFADVNVPSSQRMKAQEKRKKEKHISSKPTLKKLPEKQEKGKKTEEKREVSGVNLLPEEFSTKVDFRGRGMLLGISVGATVVVLALIYGALVLYESSIVARTRTATETRQQIEAEIAALDSEQTASIAFEDRLNLVDALLNQHVYWTKFFGLLEAYTVDDVYYSGSIRLSTPGTYSLAAIGRDYASVARQLMAFRQAIADKVFISDVEITDAQQSQDTDGVTTTKFTVTLTLLPNVNTYTPEEYLTAQQQQSITQTVPTTVPTTPGTDTTLDPTTILPSL